MDFEESAIVPLLGHLALTRFARRNVALFTLGIYTGFRITELLSITISDVYEDGHIKDTLRISAKHMKRKKHGRAITLAAPAKAALLDLINELREQGYWQGTDYMFQSSRRGNVTISRSYAWQIIHDAARAAGITTRIGTHSMRKTFARRYYQWLLDQHAIKRRPINPLRELSKALGHRSIDSTEKYIAWQDNILSEYIATLK